MQTVNEQYAKARTISNENNDCAVIATSVAINKPYTAVHAVYAAAGRKPRRGTSVKKIDASLASLASAAGAAKPDQVRHWGQGHPTLAQWLATHRTGRHLVVVTGHAIAVIDGVVHDWGRATSGPRKRVLYSWDVTPLAYAESKARSKEPRAFEINWPKLGKRPAAECPTLED